MTSGSKRSRNPWWLAAVLSLLVAVGAAWPLRSHLSTPVEQVRLRNALVWAPEPGVSLDWPGDTPPEWFALERRPADPLIATAADGLGLAPMRSDVVRAVAVAKHLMKHPAVGRGGPIGADLATTYRRIRTQGAGYCGDYNRVFTSLATAAGLTVRSWAFSFDGYGGHGHVFDEFWDRDHKKWRMIDVFMNFMPTRDDGAVMSALEFRDALVGGRSDFAYARISDMHSQPYETEEEMSAYFKRGVGEWWMLKGNTVNSTDSHPLVVLVGPFGRTVSQAVAGVVGALPGVCPLETPENAAARGAMASLHTEIWTMILAACGAFVFGVIGVFRRGKSSRSADTTA